ncbi:MAG: DeoR/GlpR transcriptional regulator [Clostridia bacterium]|nr:DeoR/GlpR transcriptional regulator [Clostridia bacterium]
MLANERQNKILELLSRGGVTTASLVETFNVSVETIRRDLLTMERAGLITRVHGGAVRHGSMKSYPTLSERNRTHEEQKRELAEKAAALVCVGDIIGVDGGSTAVFFAEELSRRVSRLTVITYSLDVFNILSRISDFKVILCGGTYMPEENSFAGHMTIEALSNIHVQKGFIFPSAVSMENGIADFSEDICPLQARLIRSSDEVFILADSSKFEKNALIRIDDMRKTYTYVTDSSLDESLKELLLSLEYKIV